MGNILEHPNIEQFDQEVDAAFDRVRGNKITDRVFYAVSEIGNHSIVWHIVNTLQTLLTRDFHRAAGVASALGAESALINGPVKMLFRRERPDRDNEHPHQLRQPKTSSFPSGHATSAFCAAAMFSQSDPKRKPIYYAAAALVASSRVYVKIHHASDVVAGAAIGVALGALAKRLLPSPSPRNRRRSR